MSVKSGFFNSIAGDRLYDAKAFGSLFDGILRDGIFRDIGGELRVTAGVTTSVVVAIGKAWFNDSWLINNVGYVLQIPNILPGSDRIDIIALDFDQSTAVRDNTIIVIPGVPAGSPVPPPLINTTERKQYALAYVSVTGGATDIVDSDITDLVGTAGTPFASGILNPSNDGPSNRNLIINGDMTVSQRSDMGATSMVEAVTGNNDKYGVWADRWKISAELTSRVWNIGNVRMDDHLNINRPSLEVAIDAGSSIGSPTSTERFTIQQYIEEPLLRELNKGRSTAKSLTLSFTATSNVPGVYVVDLHDIVNGRIVQGTYVVDGTGNAQRHTITFPPDLTGELNGAAFGVILRFWFMAGSNWTAQGPLQTVWGLFGGESALGQVDFGLNITDTMTITDIQLEVGSVETPFERIPVEIMLQRCQRYMEMVKLAVTTAVNADGNPIVYLPIVYRERKMLIIPSSVSFPYLQYVEQDGTWTNATYLAEIVQTTEGGIYQIGLNQVGDQQTGEAVLVDFTYIADVED